MSYDEVIESRFQFFGNFCFGVIDATVRYEKVTLDLGFAFYYFLCKLLFCKCFYLETLKLKNAEKALF